MLARLFAESGLSLDRLRALLEVGAAGSIVKAAGGDPVRQSQYSRQIKELEDFFRTRLIERQGRGTRLTSSGRELARISRFFLLGLSNFQRGCLAEEQTFRIGAGATYLRRFLLPLLAAPGRKDNTSYVTEVAGDQEIERRLHDLTLDFGIVSNSPLSRPLQTTPLVAWKLQLWVPKSLRLGQAGAIQAFEYRRLPLALAGKEIEPLGALSLPDREPRLVCDSFIDALAGMEGERIAGFLPDFLAPKVSRNAFMRVPLPKIDTQIFRFHLAWNPRLMRLNPHAIHQRDWLASSLSTIAANPA